ncbi:catenin alpha-2-like, partial [Python bivittatus]|uniref:Catenin alpha-2 n=1 Tax=Python bivittatus TaxID=176946 RepID=A0A9F2WI96_PYTBI
MTGVEPILSDKTEEVPKVELQMTVQGKDLEKDAFLDIQKNLPLHPRMNSSLLGLNHTHLLNGLEGSQGEMDLTYRGPRNSSEYPLHFLRIEVGETMRIASSEFADDPCSSVKRGTMVRAARALLSAVTRLLILADMADVMRLLSHLKIVEEALEAVKNATNEQDLANRFKEFGKEMVKLNYVAARRQQELKDPHCRDEMAAARGALKKNATMLYTASQAFLRHPDVAATRANRDYVFKQVQEAIAGISNAAQATSPTDENKGHTGIGELAAALNEFDNKIILDPMTFSEARFRPSLEERLESIISGAALMADSSCTRDDRRERIVAECNAVRQALQDLLTEYMNN